MPMKRGSYAECVNRQGKGNDKEDSLSVLLLYFVPDVFGWGYHNGLLEARLCLIRVA